MKDFQEMEKTFKRLVAEGKEAEASAYLRNYLALHPNPKDHGHQAAQTLLMTLKPELCGKSLTELSQSGQIQAFEGMPCI